ncbi:MAG: lipoate--protein ligase family protein [Tepidiformaceae bacterium]
MERLRLVRTSYLKRPALDTAVSHALLRRVAAGLEPDTLRLNVPPTVVAFGPADAVSPQFPDAVSAARGAGFEAVSRLAGGRAAVFHEGTISFTWAIADSDAKARITPRFEAVAALMAEAFREMGIDARVGEVPGEYCPGQYSVNARGLTKVMGVGQRVVAGAAHLGGVVVVDGAERIRDVLVPVYAALGLEWDPETCGALADEMAGLDRRGIEGAIIQAFKRRFDVYEGDFGRELLALAAELEPRHEVPR